jgi:hypothetical protein
MRLALAAIFICAAGFAILPPLVYAERWRSAVKEYPWAFALAGVLLLAALALVVL